MSFYKNEYNKIAKDVLNESIKTAIFIDENAWEPYTEPIKSENANVIETQKLSKYLYEHFYSKQISLTIHKFKDIDSTKPFLNNKDIVLLDWHLDGMRSGEEYALKLLEEIINKRNINFCCLYTNSPKESVINNCISYFSGYSNEFYENVYEEYSIDDELISKVNPFLEKILALSDPNNKDELLNISKELKKITGLAKKISDITSLKNVTPFIEKLRCLAYASKEELIKSNSNDTPIIDFLDKNNYVFTIKSTIVVILNKDHEHDKETLFNKIRKEIISKHNSYLLMLGLEMNNKLNKHAFISGDVLNIKNRTIAFHWNQNIKQENEILYKDFVKQIMVDQVDSTLKRNEFNLLNPNLLNKNKIKRQQELKQLALINTFYNGIVLEEDNRLVSFGDIFQDININENYYLCITAICDCHYPENINNNYYFVKGEKFNVDIAIDLSDEAFLSYVDQHTCIIWPNLGKKISHAKYKPVYIKPIQLHIPNPKIVNSNLEGIELYRGNKNSISLKYKLTLRNQYAQRIANHAFSYPLRIGIDFVKKK